ncbi:MAG: hypothetical protein ACI81T_004212, partial [Bacteroidia bacterium]
MAIISKKKIPFKISDVLMAYIEKYNRYSVIPIHYSDLQRYENEIALYDSRG